MLELVPGLELDPGGLEVPDEPGVLEEPLLELDVPELPGEPAPLRVLLLPP